MPNMSKYKMQLGRPSRVPEIDVSGPINQIRTGSPTCRRRIGAVAALYPGRRPVPGHTTTCAFWVQVRWGKRPESSVICMAEYSRMSRATIDIETWGAGPSGATEARMADPFGSRPEFEVPCASEGSVVVGCGDTISARTFSAVRERPCFSREQARSEGGSTETETPAVRRRPVRGARSQWR